MHCFPLDVLAAQCGTSGLDRRPVSERAARCVEIGADRLTIEGSAEGGEEPRGNTGDGGPSSTSYGDWYGDGGPSKTS